MTNYLFILKPQKKGKRFLLVVPYSYPDFSGSGRNAFNLGKFLAKRKIPVRLLTFNRGLRYKRTEYKEGLYIYRIAYLNKNLFLKIISLLWILPLYIFRILKSDIIYVFGVNIIAWQFIILFSNICGKKVILRSLILYEDDIETLISKSNYLTRILNRNLIRFINCYFSIHPGFSDSYVKVIGNRIRLLEMPQGVDPDLFHPVSSDEKKILRKKLGLPENEFIIISVAFLINRKGFGEIFEQLQLLKFPFQFLIIGEYDFDKCHFLSKLQSESLILRQKGSEFLGSTLKFTGPKENINEYIQSADVCLFNSKAEGLPNSMLEAMASGKVVICNHIAGLEGYLLHHKENSLIFSDILDLNSKIVSIYNDPELRTSIGINASKTIDNLATFDLVLNRIFSALEIE